VGGGKIVRLVDRYTFWLVVVCMQLRMVGLLSVDVVSVLRCGLLITYVAMLQLLSLLFHYVCGLHVLRVFGPNYVYNSGN